MNRFFVFNILISFIFLFQNSYLSGHSFAEQTPSVCYSENFPTRQIYNEKEQRHWKKDVEKVKLIIYQIITQLR